MHSKAFYRKKYQFERQKLSSENIQIISQNIVNQIINSKFISYDHFFIFIPIIEKNEVNTTHLIDFLVKTHKIVSIPKLIDNEMFAITFFPEIKFQKNKWNILEPTSGDILKPELIEVVFIPLLICDNQGNRIGYGKGFYDKFLSQCSESVLKVGLNFFDPIDAPINHESTDIPLDYLVTPTRIVSFKPNEEK